MVGVVSRTVVVLPIVALGSSDFHGFASVRFSATLPQELLLKEAEKGLELICPRLHFFCSTCLKEQNTVEM